METSMKKQENKPNSFINLSTLTLNTHQKEVLNLGPKYILEDNIDIYDAIPKIENSFSNLPKENRNSIRVKIEDELIKNMKMKYKKNEDIRVLKEIKKNNDIDNPIKLGR